LQTGFVLDAKSSLRWLCRVQYIGRDITAIAAWTGTFRPASPRSSRSWPRIASLPAETALQWPVVRKRSIGSMLISMTRRLNGLLLSGSRQHRMLRLPWPEVSRPPSCSDSSYTPAHDTLTPEHLLRRCQSGWRGSWLSSEFSTHRRTRCPALRNSLVLCGMIDNRRSRH
jgi:hypothetical protein